MKLCDKIKEEKELGQRIKEEVKTFNIAPEGDRTYYACVIFFFMARTGINSPYIIANRLRYNATPGVYRIERIISNWCHAGRYSYIKNEFYMDITEDHLQNVIELTLFSMLGAGEVKCIDYETLTT